MAHWCFVLLCISGALEEFSALEWHQTPYPAKRLSAMTLDDLVVHFEELSKNYNLLQNLFQEIKKSNSELQATVVYQASRLDQLQQFVEDVPRMERERRQLLTRVQALEERLAGMTTDGQVTCPEGCSEPDVSTSTKENNKTRRALNEDWITKVKPDMIKKIRQRFRSNIVARKQEQTTDSEDREDEMDEDTIKSLSRAMAKLIKKNKGNSSPESPAAEENSRPQLDVSDVQMRPLPPFNQYVPARYRRSRDSNGHNKNGNSGKNNGQGSDILVRQRRSTEEEEEEEEEALQAQLEEIVRNIVIDKKHVAFSTSLTTPLLGKDDGPQVVIFDHGEVNEGNAYDIENGVFKCHTPGVYYFSFNMRSYDDKHLGVALMLNDTPVVTMTTDASERKVMQSQSVILTLKKKDEVWLMLGPSQDFAIYARYDFTYNTLNGILLYGK
ncbi:uncharacterized protein LOC144442289 [Glandiceps talaboti]